MPEAEPAWWPDGADERFVRDCNCDYCATLIDALEDYRDGVAVTGDDHTLAAFSGGAEA